MDCIEPFLKDCCIYFYFYEGSLYKASPKTFHQSSFRNLRLADGVNGAQLKFRINLALICPIADRSRFEAKIKLWNVHVPN